MASIEHERGIDIAKKWITETEGYELVKLEEINGYIPDLYAQQPILNDTEKEASNDTVRKALIEVETEESYTQEYAKKQMLAFSKWSEEIFSRRTILYVPNTIFTKAKNELPDYDEYYSF